MSESPKKQKMTPQQKVKFAENSKAVTPIKKFQKEVEVLVSTWVNILPLSDT